MYTYQVVNFVVPAGSTGITERETLKEGLIVAAAVYTPEDNFKGSVNLAIKNNGGSLLIDPTCLEDWKRREGGSYIESMKPMGFAGGKSIVIEITPALGYADISNEQKGQIVFVIEQPDNC